MKLKDFLFSTKYGSILYHFKYYFGHKLPFSKYWWEYNFPYYHWWSVRKYFKRPKAHLYIGKPMWFFGFPLSQYLNPIIDVRLHGLMWKDKWNSPRHECDPYFSIMLFEKWHFLWTFNWMDKKDEYDNTRSMATWEAVLDILYYNKDIEWCKKRHVWLSKDYRITIDKNLTDYGKGSI